MKYDYIVYIGRFEPAHLGHLATLQKAAQLGAHVIVLIGSADRPRTVDNPWNADEREAFLRLALQEQGLDEARFSFAPIKDFTYMNQRWAEEVQGTVASLILADDGDISTSAPVKQKLAIIGYDKDSTTEYLKFFPQWEQVEMADIDGLHSTAIRRTLFESGSLAAVAQALPASVQRWVEGWVRDNPDEFKKLVEQYQYYAAYAAKWKPTFYGTADAVVVQAGHILLVKRRSNPGKGLWALPGGFVHEDETFESTMIRELREETRLKVPERVLRKSITASRLFDDIRRSKRGRVITNAYLIELEPGELPEVRGSSDALRAQWVPISVFRRMEAQVFEDHFHIASFFLGRM